MTKRFSLFNTTHSIMGITVIAVTLFLISGCSKNEHSIPSKPKLILQITVDQLRGDLPDRYLENMGEGGFRYLMKNGIWYANAHYGHTNTETVVGHTVLATGADPAVNGMISNVWFDRDTGKLAYNIEDNRYHILTTGADIDESTEIDTSQILASTDGRSPSNILVTTFSDELAMFTNGKSKIYGVSVKDRGAVTLAGHAGKAFWFSKSSGGFITSSYYYDKNPPWLDSWNALEKARVYEGKSWELLFNESEYLFNGEDNRPGEVDISGFGTVFPHSYGSADNPNFNNYLTFSPAGDELTLDFAKYLMESEKMGLGDTTDYLSISFSSTDYVGHIFGNSSLEQEDNILRLDRTLANLFSFVDEKVGLDNTLIVLSADHGGPENPDYWRSFGVDSGYVSPDEWDREPSITALKEQFGIGEELIQEFFPPYIYLNREVIEAMGLDLGEVEQAVADELMGIKGVALAISSNALKENRLPDVPLIRSALRNYNPKRSGDVLILFQPQYFINHFDGEAVSCNHGGPWRYDSFVPVVFAGGRITGQRVYREVEPLDVAPTLAAIMRTKPPSGSRGLPLEEVIQGVKNSE